MKVQDIIVSIVGVALLVASAFQIWAAVLALSVLVVGFCFLTYLDRVHPEAREELTSAELRALIQANHEDVLSKIENVRGKMSMRPTMLRE